MNARTGKIARLPKPIREELNRRIENGERGRPIVKWLNTLPEVQQMLADQFESKPIREQNLSEWRKGGYHDWIIHQQRLDWYDRLHEQDEDLDQHDYSGDTFESVGRFMIAEVGMALNNLQQIKNPNDRWTRLEHLSREFARLQNAYNWSRRVQLDWDNRNDKFKTDDHDSPETEIQEIPKTVEPLRAPAPVLQSLDEGESRRQNPTNIPEPENTTPPAPVIAVRQDFCILPSALPEESAYIRPLPPPPPVPSNPPYPLPQNYNPAPPNPPIQKHIVHSIPIRGRRFTGIDL